MSDYSAAALRDPVFRFMHSIYTSIGNSPSEIERFRRLLATAQAKTDTLIDRKWKREYQGWCDYIEDRINKSEAEYAGRPARRKAYEEDQQKRDAAISNLLSENPPH